MNKIIILILLGLLGLSNLLKADSWEAPKVCFYYSQNNEYKLKIVPTIIPEKYTNWRYSKSNKRNKFTPRDTTIIHCYAELYRTTNHDSVLVWKRTLINSWSPVSVVVSNDGKSIVTFDNWATLGYGLDVMVVYNEFGDLIKRYQLEDISPFPINDYFISISSLWWNCGNNFIDNDRVEICFCDKEKNIRKRIFDTKKLIFSN